MKLFTRNTASEYNDELNLIWEYLNSQGTPHFNKKSLETLWRDYSDEVWAAGFINVSQDTLEGFVNWLENYDL